ncbi:non-ribosomal peptide synthetase [Aquimarina aquimarini]|uniref:non-ribosomal peptide synthetase n=1 Tax=Aquimarina aquimarini TaxID=1191734 RepID=UPI000D559968|nr:non-ribosomal peptide synthetase [Aquimarina aquimarini]
MSEVQQSLFPLSYSQESLWLLDKTEGSTHYQIPYVYNIQGKIDVQNLEDSLKNLVEKYTSLRTVFDQQENGDVYQSLLPSHDWNMFYSDAYKEDTKLVAYIDTLKVSSFDLANDYMLKAYLFKLDTAQYKLLLVMHHIAFDGWSNSILINELNAFYNQKRTTEERAFEKIEYTYIEYAAHQRSAAYQKSIQTKLDYWKEQLKDSTPLQFPLDFSRNISQGHTGKNYVTTLGVDLSNQIKSFARTKRATPYMLLLSIFKVLLYKYTGKTDIVIGCPTANRKDIQTQKLIGYFVNSIALRTHISGDIVFKELLDQVKNTIIRGYEHQEVPFDEVIRTLGIKKVLGETPLFQILFIMQNNQEAPAIKLDNAIVTEEPFEYKMAKYDITFSITEKQGDFEVYVEYRDSLFKPETIERLVNHFRNLILEIIKDGDIKVSAIKMITEKEKNQMLDTCRTTSIERPIEKNTVLDMFKKQVKNQPNETAILVKDTTMSYVELDKKSDEVAHFLISKGVESKDIIGVCVKRSFEIAITILGIWKAGAIYVPLDEKYPEERTRYIIENSKTKYLICSDKNADNHIDFGIESILFSSIAKEPQKEVSIDRSITRDMLAYIIYTSGSTGKPKGVMISHDNLQAFLNWSSAEFAKDQHQIVYATTSICFDLSIFEFFYSLTSGKKIRILEDGLSIPKYLLQDKNILINTVPSVINHLQNNKVIFENVTEINMAGEPIPEQVMKRLDWDAYKVRNLYGPSEDTTYSTCWLMNTSRTSYIGKPIANTKAYVLDNDLNLVPEGIIGELYLSGKGVSAGYFANERLTQKKFLDNPFEKDGSKLYKTGDMVRWLPEGVLAYIGRKDTQVKIRGYRIELGEIETIINKVSFVEKCVVAVKKGEDNEQFMVAYVVIRNIEDWYKKVKSHLENKIPGYMVPAHIIKLDNLPLTPNGKIDKKALPEVKEQLFETIDYVAPTNVLEKELVAICKKVLHQNKIGIHDNFFDLGAHSMMLAKLAFLIRTQYTISIEVHLLFELSTVAKLAKYITILKQGQQNEEEYEVVDLF